jgi:CP family cyanate transporter-like MFS transporter
LLIVGILLVAANLRAAITVVGPLLGDVRGDLYISAAAASALISLPVLCFAVFSPITAPIANRLGMERTLGLALALLTVGILARSAPYTPALWTGTVVLGIAIAAMNVVLPALLKRDFPSRAGRLTGATLPSKQAPRRRHRVWRCRSPVARRRDGGSHLGSGPDCR